MKIHYKWSFSIAMLNYQTVRKMTNGGIGNGPTVYGAGFSEAVSRHPPLMGGHLRALWIIQFESHFFAVTQPKSVYLTCKNIGLQNLMNVYNYHILIRIDHPFAEKKLYIDASIPWDYQSLCPVISYLFTTWYHRI